MHVELKAMEKPVSGTQAEYIPNLSLDLSSSQPNHPNLMVNLLVWLHCQTNHPLELGGHTKLHVCH